MSTQGSHEQEQQTPPYHEWDADQLREALADRDDDLAELTPWRDGYATAGIAALNGATQIEVTPAPRGDEHIPGRDPNWRLSESQKDTGRDRVREVRDRTGEL